MGRGARQEGWRRKVLEGSAILRKVGRAEGLSSSPLLPGAGRPGALPAPHCLPGSSLPECGGLALTGRGGCQSWVAGLLLHSTHGHRGKDSRGADVRVLQTNTATGAQMMEVREVDSSLTKYGDWPIVESEMPGLMASTWEYRAHWPSS